MPSLSINDITNSITVPALILDKELKNVVFEYTNLGLPIKYVGGFSVVFPAYVGSKKYAFRCWHADIGNLQDRYKAIDKYLNNLKLPYFCDFKYVEKGIIVNGVAYPTTRMDWINGLPIKKYLKNNISKPSVINDLSKKFIQMVHDLHVNRISHGDLQHGNILVTPHGEIRLVDYDSIFIPDLKNESDDIKGLAGYQHPSRKKNFKLSPKSDYFSELIIYLSIIALSKNPDLFLKYDIENTECMLFTPEDFKDLENAKIYSELKGLDDEIGALLEVLKSYLKTDSIENLEDFESLLVKVIEVPIIHHFTSATEVLLVGMKAKLHWEVQSYQTLKIVEEEGNTFDVSGTSEIEIFPRGSGVYRLVAKNYTKTVLAEHKFQVFPTPIIEKLFIPTPEFTSSTNIQISVPDFTQFEHIKLIPKLEIYKIELKSSLSIPNPNTIVLKYKFPKETLSSRIGKVFKKIKNKTQK
jgi:serine/threonine protein kinase